MGKIFVVGSLNIDLVFYLDRLPHVGETIISDSFEINEGGKGNNQAVAIAKQEKNVYMVGSVGDDNFGSIIKENLLSNNVNIDYLTFDSKSSTGIASIYIHNTNNSIVLNSGANYNVKKEQIDEALSKSEIGDLVICQLEIPIDIVEYTLKKAKELKLITILNPAPVDGFKIEMLKYVDYLIPNEIEAGLISGKENIHEMIDYLNNLNVFTIITLGDKGLIYKDKNMYIEVKSHDVEVVDTTAAGDTLIGVFASCLLEEDRVHEALERANAAAAITITRKGAQKSIPTKIEIDNFLKGGAK